MEQRNNLVLQGTETFSRGQLDNVALENGALVLDSVAGRSLQYGSYTTPEFAMPAFCNLNVSWNAHAPHNTMVEVRCRVYAGAWTGWMSFGKWAPDYPRCSVSSQSEDGMIFLMGDTVTVAAPGGGTGVQLQVNLSTNDDKVSPGGASAGSGGAASCVGKAQRPPAEPAALSAGILPFRPRPQLWAGDGSAAGHGGADEPLGRGYSAGGSGLRHGGRRTSSTGNAAFAAAAAGCCGYPCWQAWMDLADLREQIHDGCSVAVQVERRVRGQRDPARLWMGLRGFGHDDAVMADFVLLNDPTADTDGAVNCTMALVDFMRYFTGKAIALRPKQREAEADRPRRLRCDLRAGTQPGVYYFERRGEPADLPEDFSGWIACAPHDGVAHATTAHRTFLRCTRTEDGGVRSRRSCWPQAGATACMPWTRPARCG